MDIRDALAARAAGVQRAPGASSYFSRPSRSLDPALFVGERMRPDVRRQLLGYLYDFWAGKGYARAERWSTAYLCGSGASFQWEAAREPGDLDILIGVDHALFRQGNPDWQGVPDGDIDRALTDVLRAELWPGTANALVGGKRFEVTFYVNQGGRDIRSINPYAAYDLNEDRWAVHPIEIPDEGPGSWFGIDYVEAANRDVAAADDIVTRHRMALDQLAGAGSPGQRVNAAAALERAAREASDLFDRIHLGRHDAFAPTGLGFRDWANYRWQAGKRSGVVQQLGALREQYVAARQESNASVYGKAQLDDAHEALLRAALWGKV